MIFVIILLVLLIILIKKLYKLLNNNEDTFINDVRIKNNKILKNNKQYAYVTLVTNDLYVPGVIALGKSMNKAKCKYKKICLYKDISDKSISQIKKTKFDLININDINKKGIKININLDKYNYNVKRFKDAFNKLYIWTLIKYKKIIYLDCDMVIYQNIDNLFMKPSISAVRGKPLFNSGLMVIEPDMKIFNGLNKLINEPYKWTNKKDLLGKTINDQALLSAYFKKYNKLPVLYNVTKSYHSKIKNPIVKHWNYKKKPWFNKISKNREWYYFYNL